MQHPSLRPRSSWGHEYLHTKEQGSFAAADARNTTKLLCVLRALVPAALCPQICVAVMKPCGKLQVANLGDSGVRLIRDGKILFASTVRAQQWGHDCQSVCD